MISFQAHRCTLQLWAGAFHHRSRSERPCEDFLAGIPCPNQHPGLRRVEAFQRSDEIPGGFADKDEDPQKAIEREFLEETGYAFSHFEFVGEVAANPGVLSGYTKLYLATGGKKIAKQVLDHNEEIEIVLVPLSEVKSMLLQNKFDQALHTCCIFYALQKLEDQLKL